MLCLFCATLKERCRADCCIYIPFKGAFFTLFKIDVAAKLSENRLLKAEACQWSAINGAFVSHSFVDQDFLWARPFLWNSRRIRLNNFQMRNTFRKLLYNKLITRQWSPKSSDLSFISWISTFSLCSKSFPILCEKIWNYLLLWEVPGAFQFSIDPPNHRKSDKRWPLRHWIGVFNLSDIN